jgi:hypothetical protein
MALRSSCLLTFERSSMALVNAWTASADRCTFSARLDAVTTTSPRTAPPGVEAALDVGAPLDVGAVLGAAVAGAATWAAAAVASAMALADTNKRNLICPFPLPFAAGGR